MAEDFDTSWFDLKRYDQLEDLDLKGWYNQITERNYIGVQIFEGNYEIARELSDRIKANPIIPDDEDNYDWAEWKKDHQAYPFNAFSVRSTPAIQFWANATDSSLSDIWKCCEDVWPLDNWQQATEEQKALVNIPLEVIRRQREIYHGSYTHLTVNLSATDEQIIKDFRHWLTEIRKTINYESKTKNFTDKDLSEWVQWRLLPCIDLSQASMIEEKDLKQTKVARLIFDDEFDVDIVDRLRRTTIPKATWLLRHQTLDAIEAQLLASA